MEWRKQWEVDKLTKWDPPKILKDYLPHGLCGFDKDGAPGINLFYLLTLNNEINMLSLSKIIKLKKQFLEILLIILRNSDIFTVIVVYFDALDLYGILHVVSRMDIIKMTIKCLEEYLMLCREQMLKHGPLAGQVVVIFDMQGFNLRQYLWRPGKIYMHHVIYHYYISLLWYI